MKIVNYGGQAHKFPDDASDAEIRATLESADANRSTYQKITGLATDAAGKIITNIGNAIISPLTAIPGAQQLLEKLPDVEISVTDDKGRPVMGAGRYGGGMFSKEAAAAGTEAGYASARPIAKDYIVPQTPVEAATQAATLAVGPAAIALKGSKFAAPIVKAAPNLARQLFGGPTPAVVEKAVTKYGPAVGRTATGALAGETAGQLSGEDAGVGGMLGGLSTAVGEGINLATPFLARILGGGKQQVNRLDTQRVMDTLEELAPEFRGTTHTKPTFMSGPGRAPEDMQRLVRGEGLEVLGAQKEATHQAVEKGLVGVTGTSWNQVLKPGEIPMPSLGTRTKPFDASKPAGISLRAANEELTRVGDMLHGRLPLDPRYREVPIDKLYAQLRKEIGDGIELAGGTQGPALRAMWETGQTNYHRGRQLYDWLRDTTGLIDNNGYLNMRVLQKTLKDDPQKVAKLVDAIGPDDYKKLENAVFRGAFPMKTDRPITGEGGHLSALRQFFRREGGEGSLRSIQIPVLTLFPNTGQYVGKVPQRAVPEVLQRGVTGFSQSVGINPENQPHPVTAGAQKGAAKTGSGLQEAARLWTLGARRILPASLFQ